MAAATQAPAPAAQPSATQIVAAPTQPAPPYPATSSHSDGATAEGREPGADSCAANSDSARTADAYAASAPDGNAEVRRRPADRAREGSAVDGPATRTRRASRRRLLHGPKRRRLRTSAHRLLHTSLADQESARRVAEELSGVTDLRFATPFRYPTVEASRIIAEVDYSFLNSSGARQFFMLRWTFVPSGNDWLADEAVAFAAKVSVS